MRKMSDDSQQSTNKAIPFCKTESRTCAKTGLIIQKFLIEFLRLLAVTSLEKDSIVDVFLEKLNFGSFHFTEMHFVSCSLELHGA